MPNRVISTKVSTERGEILIKAAQAAELSYTSVTPGSPYRSLEGAEITVELGKTWVIVETGTEGGSKKFFTEVERIESSKK